eukprot:1569367-Rhodomonas_salina.11
MPGVLLAGCVRSCSRLRAAAAHACDFLGTKRPRRRVSDVNAVHARHSGAKALFLTPFVLRDVGDENLEPASRCGDVLFAFEPKSICNHEDASEVAWLSTMMPAFRVAGPGLGRR